MSAQQADMLKAANLNLEVMRMANQTAEHQREQKLVAIVQTHALNSRTLAAAIASLEWSSTVDYRQTAELRRTMKILLDAQMHDEAIHVQELAAALMREEVDAQKVAVTLMGKQILSQEALARANDRDAAASRLLATVNVFLALAAVGLAVAQVWIALHPPH